MIKINRHSIFFNITIIFLISMLFISLTFFIIIKNSENIHNNFLKRKYSRIINSVLYQIHLNGGIVTKNIRKRLLNMNIEVLDAKKSPKYNLMHMNNVCNFTMPMYKMRVYQKANHYYISLKNPMMHLLLKDNNSDVRNTKFMLITLIVIVIILLFSYISIIRKLYPLKVLQSKIKKMGEGDFDIDYQIKGKDEISVLSSEFDKAIKNLKKLKESRNIFLRNIMHELKTPITKGRFLTKLPSSSVNTEKMERVFLRLETLINEFATIEELISSEKEIIKKEYFVIDIVDNALDLLFEEGDFIDIQNSSKNKKIAANFKLFSIAIKNLIDNAIKYSKGTKAIIKITENKISFINKGEKLKYPLEKYYEPFFKESSKANQSFGLGLYIVHNILETHNLTLRYRYENNNNIFYIMI